MLQRNACILVLVIMDVSWCNSADDASDGARSQLSADLPDDEDEDDDGAGSCCSSADNQSVNSAAENSTQRHDDDAQSQRPSPHQANTAAAAAAAAALISDQYSVETLLANVQALLKLAMDSARHREQQASIKAGQYRLVPIFLFESNNLISVC